MRRSRRQKIWIACERLCVIAGCVGIAIYVGSQLHSAYSQAHDRRIFERALSERLLPEPAPPSGAARPVPPSAPGRISDLLFRGPRAGDLMTERPRMCRGSDSLLERDVSGTRWLAYRDRGPDQSEWSLERIRAYAASTARGRGEQLPLGRLDIPAIGLSVMVLPGTDGWTLNRAVGHIEGTAFPGDDGNVGIAGHRDGFFRGLRNVSVHDRIFFTTLEAVYEYRIEDLSVVEPNEVEVLEQTRRRSLTLVTCYPFYFVGNAPQRFIVHAVEIARREHQPV